MRFSEEAPTVDEKLFLPFYRDENEIKMIITDRTKAIALRLRKARLLPNEVDLLLSQIGAFEDGGQSGVRTKD
jgi:hypothetical protein